MLSHNAAASVGVSEVRHPPGRRLCGRQLWGQRLDRLLRHRQVSGDDCAQAPLLLQREVRTVEALPTAPLHATGPL